MMPDRLTGSHGSATRIPYRNARDQPESSRFVLSSDRLPPRATQRQTSALSTDHLLRIVCAGTSSTGGSGWQAEGVEYFLVAVGFQLEKRPPSQQKGRVRPQISENGAPSSHSGDATEGCKFGGGLPCQHGIYGALRSLECAIRMYPPQKHQWHPTTHRSLVKLSDSPAAGYNCSLDCLITTDMKVNYDGKKWSVIGAVGGGGRWKTVEIKEVLGSC